MSAAVPQLMTHITGRLAAINGAGSYVTDLSAADRVIIGQPPGAGAVHLVPSVFLYDIQTDTAPGPQLTQWRHVCTMSIVGFVAATDDSEEALLRAAWVLASDIHRSVVADRSPNITGAIVEDVRTQSDATSGGGLGYQGLGVVGVQITIAYRGDL